MQQVLVHRTLPDRFPGRMGVHRANRARPSPEHPSSPDFAIGVQARYDAEDLQGFQSDDVLAGKSHRHHHLADLRAVFGAVHLPAAANERFQDRWLLRTRPGDILDRLWTIFPSLLRGPRHVPVRENLMRLQDGRRPLDQDGTRGPKLGPDGNLR